MLVASADHPQQLVTLNIWELEIEDDQVWVV
jgi:hypothetical protein